MESAQPGPLEYCLGILAAAVVIPFLMLMGVAFILLRVLWAILPLLVLVLVLKSC